MGLCFEVRFEDASKRFGSLHGSFSKLPFIDWHDVETLIHEQNQIGSECLVDRDQAAWLFLGFERKCKSFSEPENRCDVGDIANHVDRSPAMSERERVLLNQFSHVGAKECRNILLKVVLVENFVEQL